MKQQIAGFLGELAEELGWAPDLDQARVRPEMSQPKRPQTPAVPAPDPRDLRSLATPVERMRGELEQLRATVKHLGSEVTQLRAQMAHLRRLPVPPDADDPDVAEAAGSGIEVAAAAPVEPSLTDGEAVSTTEAGVPEARPWPPQLMTRPAADAAAAVSGQQPVADRPPVAEAPPAHEPVEQSDVESAVDRAADDTAPEAAPADPAAGSVDQQPAAQKTATSAVEEVDEQESGLELFASEPASGGDDLSHDEAPSGAGTKDSTDVKRSGKSLYRRMGSGTT